MACGSGHRGPQRLGRIRCPVHQLCLAGHCEGLGTEPGHAWLGAVDGVGGHGLGLGAARRCRRQDWTAPDHPRLSLRDVSRHVRRQPCPWSFDPAHVAAADRPRNRRHAGVDQCGRRGIIQPALAEPGRVPDGDRLSGWRSDRRHHRAKIVGRRHLALGLRLRRVLATNRWLR
jgi:hypothetical protein